MPPAAPYGGVTRRAASGRQSAGVIGALRVRAGGDGIVKERNDVRVASGRGVIVGTHGAVNAGGRDDAVRQRERQQVIGGVQTAPS